MGFTCPKLLRELRGEARQHPRSVLEERVCDDARLGSFRPASPFRQCGWPGTSDCLITSVESFSNVASFSGLNELPAWSGFKGGNRSRPEFISDSQRCWRNGRSTGVVH